MSRFFFRGLAVLFAAGLPIDRCLEILARQDERSRAMLLGLGHELRTGSSLSAALRKQPGQFSPFQVHMVRMGEQTGSLALVLGNLADHAERSDELTRKVRATLTYPALVLLVSVAMVVLAPPFLMRGQFELLRSHGQEPPWISRVLMLLSDLTRSPLTWVLGAAALYALARLLGTGRARARLAHLPVLRPLLRTLALARFSEALSQLLRSGVLLSEALPLAASVSSSSALAQAIPRALQALRDGQTLSGSLRATGFFPAPYLAMLEVAEGAGKLPDLTAWMANLYRLELHLALERFTALLEPLVLLVMGVLVGGMLLATLLPILSTLQAV